MWYPFDEIVNGQLKGSKPAEIIGDVQLVEGKAYKALYIDGVHDQYVNLGNLRQYCVGDLRHCQHGLVISVWLRPHVKKPGGYHYFTNGGHTRGSIGVLLAQLDEHLIAFFRNDTGPWTITKVPFEVLNWYFVTMVWDPNSGARLYLNGCLAGEDLTLKNDASNSNGQYNDFIIGASNFPQDRTTTRAEMTMDELKIWDARMTENQVWDLYLCHIWQFVVFPFHLAHITWQLPQPMREQCAYVSPWPTGRDYWKRTLITGHFRKITADRYATTIKYNTHQTILIGTYRICDGEVV